MKKTNTKTKNKIKRGENHHTYHHSPHYIFSSPVYSPQHLIAIRPYYALMDDGEKWSTS